MDKKRRNINPKKGASAIEAVIGLLIFILLFGFFYDLFMITNKEFVVNRQIAAITRTVSVQGGVTRSAPKGYSDSQTYQNGAQLKQSLTQALKGAHIQQDEYLIFFKSYDKNNALAQTVTLINGTDFPVDYEQRFEVEIIYDYKWQIMGQLIPGMSGKRSSSTTRSSVSEYRYHTLSDAGHPERGLL